MRIQNSFSVKYFALFAVMFVFGANIFAQTKPAEKPTVKTDLPKVTQVDEITVKELFAAKKENAKPLLINFWATWCVPCREEFPDLVKIDEEFRGKIDFITITLDDPAELNRDVPQFLIEMKAKMPTYLLYTSKESEVIGGISKNWSGGLPFTVLYNEKREIVFTEQGIIKLPILKAKINELLQKPSANFETNSFLKFSEEDYNLGKSDAQKDISNNVLVYKTSGLNRFHSTFSTLLKEKYGISVQGRGCLVTTQSFSYDRGYNEVLKIELIKRFGEDVIKKARTEAEELSRNKHADVVELKLTVN